MDQSSCVTNENVARPGCLEGLTGKVLGLDQMASLLHQQNHLLESFPTFQLQTMTRHRVHIAGKSFSNGGSWLTLRVKSRIPWAWADCAEVTEYFVCVGNMDALEVHISCLGYECWRSWGGGGEGWVGSKIPHASPILVAKEEGTTNAELRFHSFIFFKPLS